MAGTIVLRQVADVNAQAVRCDFSGEVTNRGPQWDYVSPTPDMEG